ncbi:hypothetical protein ZIOFF_003950 [Zingiber officinale]|uniref:Uncharacterized protein n=1 Tax=Zingiber officinale TaxID=94328 RepID=A0A8J5INI7_ZINOF|nr:hypothetical protein ZIOFF_003950 [Zingiber officinale]
MEASIFHCNFRPCNTNSARRRKCAAFTAISNERQQSNRTGADFPSPPADRKGGTHFGYEAKEIKIQCDDCDESIHVDSTHSANHQHYLATGIHVALNTICNKDSNDNNEPPSEASAIVADSATKALATQVISSFMNSAWDVDGFHQLLDHETVHKGSPVGFGELDWFADIDIFDGQMPKGIQTVAQ